MNLANLLYLTPVTILLPLGLALYKFQQLNKAFRVIGIFLLVSLISDVFVVALAVQQIPNLWVWGYYGMVEMCLLAGFFYFFLPHTAVRLSIVLNLLAFLTYTISSRLLLGHPIEIMGKVQVVESALVVLYCIVYLVWNYRDPLRTQNFQKPYFSLISGFIWYFTGNIFFYSVVHIIYAHPDLNLWQFFFFHNFNHVVMNLLIARAFWLWPKTSSALAPHQRPKT